MKTSECFICGKPAEGFEGSVPICDYHKAVLDHDFRIIIEAKKGTTERLGHRLYVRKEMWDQLFTGLPPKARCCFVDSIVINRLSCAMNRALTQF